MKHGIVWESGPAQETKQIPPKETRKLYQRAFNIINKKLFNDELPNIEIDFAENPIEEIQKAFGDTEALFFPSYNGKPLIILDLKGAPEIGISTDTIEDLFHEMAHYYCFLHGIKDTDGKDYEYHNLAFKKVIEDHGGKCGYSDNKIGYSDTELNEKILWKIFDEI